MRLVLLNVYLQNKRIMETNFGTLVDKLVGADINHKSEEIIKAKEYVIFLREYNELKSFWGKAFFIHYLGTHPEPRISAISSKIFRRDRSQEPAITKRYLEPHLKEIKRLTFVAGGMGEIIKKLIDTAMNNGHGELVRLLRLKFYCDGSDGEIAEIQKKISLKLEDKILLNTPYL